MPALLHRDPTWFLRFGDIGWVRIAGSAYWTHHTEAETCDIVTNDLLAADEFEGPSWNRKATQACYRLGDVHPTSCTMGDVVLQP
jgi:hypothetical protein